MRGRIFLGLAPFFLLTTITGLRAQKISGKMLDNINGDAIPSVAIHEKNSNRIAVSDSNGMFSITLEHDKPVKLTFSHVSYQAPPLSFKMPRKDTAITIVATSRPVELQQVAVVRAPQRQVLTESFSQTNVDEKVMEEKIATSLIDVLQEAPGITKRGEYHSPIALRGLGGKRLLVTKDGNRRMGNSSGGFMGQGVNIYDLAKVEIIRGPASVTYGPGAVSGIINMESKSPFLKPGLHGRVLASYANNNNERSILESLNWASLNHAFSFSSRYRIADEYVCGKGETARNSMYRDKDFRLAYSTENDHALTLTAESELHLGGPWGRPVGFNGTEYMKVTNKVDNTWHSSLTTIWQPERKLKRVEASVYFDQEYRQQVKDSYDVGSKLLSYREDVRYSNYYLGWRQLSVFSLSKRLGLSTGTDGVYYRVESPTEYTDYFLSTTINNRVTKDAGVSLAGLFAETEYKSANDKVKIRLGLRGDYSGINEGDVHDTTLDKGRNADVHAWNGTSGIVYSAARNLFLSFQLARSCRMPDASEMFVITSNADGLVYGNSSLTPEFGVNVDAGIRGNIGPLTFDCSPFINFLHDFISLEYWTNSGKKGINYTYYNIDKARIFGVELSVGAKILEVFHHPDNRIIYNGTFVATRGDKLTGEPNWFNNGVPLRNIPPFNTNQDITFRRMLRPGRSWYTGGDVRFYATQNRVAPSSDGGYVSPAYCLFGASAGFTFRRGKSRWDIKLKGDNLADNKYRPFESLMYSMGRNYKVMLSIDF